MSKYKSYRVSKIVYKRIIDKRKSELSCSRDKEGNILCAGCKMLLISHDVKDENELQKMIIKILDMGGINNCCYDCEFSWYCNKCCFVLLFENRIHVSCGNSMMKQLLDSNYDRGKYSSLKNNECMTYLRKYFEKDIKRGLFLHSLKGKFADIDKIIEIYKEVNTEKNMKIYKEKITTFRKKMLKLDMNIVDELYENKTYLKQFLYSKI